MARRGVADEAGYGLAGYGLAGLTRLGMQRYGRAWLVLARLG